MAASVNSTNVPWTTWARWLCTSVEETGFWGLEILKQRREVVVSEMPNRRNDSVICPFVQPHRHKRERSAEAYVIVRAQTKDNLRVNVSGPELLGDEEVVDGLVDCGQHMNS